MSDEAAATPRPGLDPHLRHEIAQEKAARGRERVGASRLYPRVTAFRSRRGSISPQREQLWEEHWPRLGRDVTDALIDTAAWFGNPHPALLEVGSGTGTSTLAMAQAEPDLNVMAVEVYRPGHAQLLAALLRHDVTNVRLLRGDAVDVLRNMIAPGSLAGIRVFFPDPWPKARHHKRRFLQRGTFELMASRIRPGGALHIATDHVDYAAWIEEVSADAPGLRRLDPEELSSVPFSLDRPVTKFEGKGLNESRAIREFVWLRTDSPLPSADSAADRSASPAAAAETEGS